MMLMGWGTLAVPTGIVTAEMAFHRETKSTTRVCGECMTKGPSASDNYCRQCRARLSAHI
jgi:voltage-gated potassium channel